MCIASDARFYWLAQGRPENSCCGSSPASKRFTLPALPPVPPAQRGLAYSAANSAPAGTLGRNAEGRGEGPFEKLSTCLALIEIVNSCNLSCPVCYADSPMGAKAHVDAVPLEELQRRIQGVIDRKEGIEILQLSGGEPTLHPRFFELIDWVQANPGIDYLLINTNGVRIANDDFFARRLAEAAQRRHIQLYLQYDGVQSEGQHLLRGADLRDTRRRALERCGQINLPITLAMTVIPENLPFVWAAIEFGLRYPHVRGISFQPLFRSGRLPDSQFDRAPHQSRPLTPALSPSEGERETHTQVVAEPSAGGSSTTCPPRLNTADLILAAVEQSQGRLRFEDFTPLPCGDPNCATIGYLLKLNGGTRSISDFVDFSQVQDFLRDKIRYNLEDLVRCGCEAQPLGDLLRKFELDESNTFRLFIKPFMDAWTWDQDRIDRCCTHVIRPDGKLDSFCRYYSGFTDVKAAP